MISVHETSISGLFKVNRPIYRDERGFFREVVRFDELEKVRGEIFSPVQVNHARSKPEVIRALHAENWNKLVYPTHGNMFAAIVDIRPESETFGKYESFEIDSNSPYALFIPKGIANSICVAGGEDVEYVYIVDAYYDGSDTRAIAWDDPDLNIDWPVKDPIVSERDKNNPTLHEMFPEKFT